MYARAIEADPNYAYAYTNLGDLYRELGREGEAAAAFKQAAELGLDSD